MNKNFEYTMDSAPTKPGTHILVYCEPSESNPGWAEIVLDDKGNWRWVICHPYPNMCINPIRWLPVPGEF